MAHQKPGFIAVEGPIGVGKTTLARRLAETFRYQMLLEDAEENPFLERFYRNPRENALPAQLSFLLQRCRQLQRLQNQVEDTTQGELFGIAHVADYLLEKDRIFAELNLCPEELDLYEQVYAQLSLNAPAPDLVIYLQAPAEVLLRRISRRGTPSERHITRDYLEQLSDSYASFFHYYDRAPLLIVNATEINLASGDGDYLALVELIESAPTGRNYFNPLARSATAQL